MNRLFSSGNTHFNLELKFRLRMGMGRLMYREDLMVRMRRNRRRVSETMDAETNEWFCQSVERIERLDAIVFSWHQKNQPPPSPP